MFKLVGDDIFNLDDVRCIIRVCNTILYYCNYYVHYVCWHNSNINYTQVNPAPGFKFQYALYVDGKPFEQYKERQARALKTWEKMLGEKNYRIVLGRYNSFIRYLIG